MRSPLEATFAMLMGFGLFVFPVAGTLIVLGPLAGMIAGSVLVAEENEDDDFKSDLRETRSEASL